MEDTKKLPLFNKTGNLSMTQLNETVPLELDTAANDFICPVVEVKPEHLQDVKVEADSTYEDDINDPNDSNSYLTLDLTWPVVEVKQEDGDGNDIEDRNISVKPEALSCVETAVNNVHFPVEVIGDQRRPVVVLKELDLTCMKNKYNADISTGLCCHANSETVNVPFSDISGRLPQTCDSSTQVVNLSDCLTADASNQLHAASHCKQFCTAPDTAIADDAVASVENSQQPFTCEVDSEKIWKSSEFKKQMIRHTGDREFLCEVCSKSFLSKSRLNQHMLVHTGERHFCCKICKCTFTTAADLKLHMRLYADERPFYCNECTRSFVQAIHLKRHMRTHTGERPFSCKVCKRSFARADSLKAHVRIHAGERTFCSNNYEKSSELKRQMHGSDAGEQRFVCEVCSKSFLWKSRFKQHLRVHTGERPFCCNDCKSTFMTISALKQHMRIHTGEQPFCCNDCKSTFLTASALKQHMRIHTGERSLCCEVCKRNFVQKAHLKRHMRIHTGERPFCCEVCKSSFAEAGNLKVHMRMHTGERPFCCQVCKSAFVHAGHLKQHMRIHTGERPFCCKVCKRSFTKAYSLRVHMHTHARGLQKC